MKRSSGIDAEIIICDLSAGEIKLVDHGVALAFVSFLNFRGSCILSGDVSDAMDQRACIAEN